MTAPARHEQQFPRCSHDPALMGIKRDKSAGIPAADQKTLMARHKLSSYLYKHIQKHHAQTIQVRCDCAGGYPVVCVAWAMLRRAGRLCCRTYLRSTRSRASAVANLAHLMLMQVSFNTRVTDVSVPTQPGEPMIAHATRAGTAAAGSEEGSEQIACQLLLGADGAGSAVRRALQRAQPGTGWEAQVFPSVSGSLLWKVPLRHWSLHPIDA
jgi:hypothetical protein